ncbi:probable sucrose-phosphate synthase 2 [Tanacetum coccineum]
MLRGRDYLGMSSTDANNRQQQPALQIAQHHDVVTGTAKQHATNDYEKCLAIGALEAEVVVTLALSSLTSSTFNCTIPTSTLSQCGLKLHVACFTFNLLKHLPHVRAFKTKIHPLGFRDLPYYLEWEPDDISSEDLTYKKDENNTSISGEQEVAMERKVELEHKALDASTALAKIQNASSIGEKHLNEWRVEHQIKQDRWIVIRIDGCSFSSEVKVGYLDNHHKECFTEQGDTLTFETEVDQVYIGSPHMVRVFDHEKRRTFLIRKEGLPDDFADYVELQTEAVSKIESFSTPYHKLSWYLGVQANLEMLKIKKKNIWRCSNLCHRILLSNRNTLTGHSLGRNKLEQLLKGAMQLKEDHNSTYRIMRRIEAKELPLDAAELVITSTQQEIDEQWGLYDGFDVKLEKVLRTHIQEFVDGPLAHVLNMSTVLGEQLGGGHPDWPYVIHGHYANAGDSAAILSGALNVPMRKEAKEPSLDAAELVITSTQQEINEQWSLYDGFDVKLEKVLRARVRRDVVRHGRYMPRMANNHCMCFRVISPGIDFSKVIQEANDPDGDLALTNTEGSFPKAVQPRVVTKCFKFVIKFYNSLITIYVSIKYKLDSGQ